MISEGETQDELVDTWELDQALPNFSEEMFEGDRERTKLTKSQKGGMHGPGVKLNWNMIWNCLQWSWDRSSLQIQTLEEVRKGVKDREVAKEGEYFWNGGLLYHKGGVVMEEGKAREQLVLPKLCRAMVLQVAHTIPLAGHLGRNKTAQRIRQRFFLPNITKDVANYCRSCAQCQKLIPGKFAQCH